ncbi:DciA family protein [Thiobacter aerophilum]|uniref:DciA family protein n=1 Tax=Thiobacter aerophilum TaxID=3121275 RepID=A0ABV0EFN9_9BURK
MTRKLSGFLTEPISGLGRLTREAKRLMTLQQDWEAIAPPGLARFSRVTPVKDGILTLYADNGAAAAKLKAQLPRLLSSFRQRGHDVTAIQVKVQVTSPSRERRRQARKPPIPAAGLAEIAALERKLAPSPLKQALTSLLRHQGQALAQDDSAQGDETEHHHQ